MEGYEDPFNRGTFPWGHGRTGCSSGGSPCWAACGTTAAPSRRASSAGSTPRATAWPSPETLADEITVAATNAGDDPLFLTFDWPGDLATDALTGQQFLAVDGKITICLPPLDGVLLV